MVLVGVLKMCSKIYNIKPRYNEYGKDERANRYQKALRISWVLGKER